MNCLEMISCNYFATISIPRIRSATLKMCHSKYLSNVVGVESTVFSYFFSVLLTTSLTKGQDMNAFLGESFTMTCPGDSPLFAWLVKFCITNTF